MLFKAREVEKSEEKQTTTSWARETEMQCNLSRSLAMYAKSTREVLLCNILNAVIQF
jgi:hypothetical protein